MDERIKQIRKTAGLTQIEFAEKIGLTRNYVAKLEIGDRAPSDRTISDICREFRVNEIWLRTGAGEPFDNEASREVEMTELFAELMSDRPEAFRTRLVTTLLRFRPDGPEWAILEKIYENIKKEVDAMDAEAKEKETDS